MSYNPHLHHRRSIRMKGYDYSGAPTAATTKTSTVGDMVGAFQSIVTVNYIRGVKTTVAKFATVQNEGGRMVEHQVEYYDLDVIISVGYRVKSKQGTQFRIWASKILKDYLLKGYSINNRMNRIEDNLETLKNKVNEIDLQINTHLIPTQGIFFNGQVFDAYEFASKIIRSAKKISS